MEEKSRVDCVCGRYIVCVSSAVGAEREQRVTEGADRATDKCRQRELRSQDTSHHT